LIAFGAERQLRTSDSAAITSPRCFFDTPRKASCGRRRCAVRNSNSKITDNIWRVGVNDKFGGSVGAR
jgi:hypothetical protein